MMFSAKLFQANRNRCFAIAMLGLFVASLATESFAQERKFVVMLAAPIKTMRETEYDLNDLPNVSSIYSAYFDRTNDTINSFAEYWNEISYGTVNVSGNVFGWAEIPWPVLPLGDYQIDENATSIAAEILPWIDLTGGGDDGDGGDEADEVYDEFAGEDVNDAEQMILIDNNGDLPGTATIDPPSPPAANIPTTGFIDTWPDGQTPCWTPGERFADIDGDERYDALLEATMDGWADGGEQPPPVCARDGIIEDEEVCDDFPNPPVSGIFGDGDGSWDYPEPFEDFIVIYIPDPTQPQGRWVRLDPSWKNANEGDPETVGSRQWAVAYIQRNYPGDVGTPNFPQGTTGTGFMERFGNDKYDGPDKWSERGNAKLQMQGGNNMMRGLGGIRSPSPEEPTNSPVYPAVYPRWSYTSWWQDFWVTKHTNAMVAPPAPPDAPAWPPSQPTAGGGGTPNVPNMLPFNPQLPSNGVLPRPFDLRAFNPNCGGTTARKGIGCVEDPAVGGGPRIDPREPPTAKCCVPAPGSTPPFNCSDSSREDCEQQGGTWDITLRCQGNNACPAGGQPNTICFQDEAVSGGAPYPPPVLPDDFCPTQPWVEPAEGGFEHEGEIGGDPECTQCHNEIRLCVDRPTAGNGEVDPRASNGVDLFNTDVPVFPDRLNTNDDEDFDYYDGPAEFDDLPSSIYHARSISGLDYGGDMAFGEVTSTRNESIFGEDIGAGNPGDGGGSGDQVVPPAGPLSFNIHGANGFDGGNQVTIEWLTWCKDGQETDPVDVLKRDFNLDGLLDQGEVRKPGTENYAIDLDRGSPNDGGGGSNYPFNRTRLVEDTIEALDLSVDFDDAVMRVRPVCAQYEGLAGFGTHLAGDGGEFMAADGNFGAFVVGQFGGQSIGQLSLAFPPKDNPAPTADTPRIIKGMDAQPSIDIFSVVVWAADTASDELLKAVFTPDDGWVVTVVGRLVDVNNVVFTDIDGLAFDANHNILYGSDTANNQLVRINTTTAKVTIVGPFGCVATGGCDQPGVGCDVQGLAYDTNDNILYGVDSAFGILVTINTTSGAASPVSGAPIGFDEVKGLAYNPPSTQNPLDPANDTLWATSAIGSGSLIRIDTTTGIGQSNPSTVNFLHATTFIPQGLYQDGLAPGGRGLFQLPAPSMSEFIQVQEEFTPIFFSDFTTALDSRGENGQNAAAEDFAVGLMAHEWLHVWEGYPDLYDYDVYINGLENFPIAIWDIMAGGLVHPSPFLKEFGGGVCQLGTDHEPWIETHDLLDVLTPFENLTVSLTDFAFDAANATYYFQNPNVAGERFYFWRLTRVDPTPPRINFSQSLPGDGIMIMHTDFGQNFGGFNGNFEGFPLQQRIGTHFAYQIVQADGEIDFAGDAGDPFGNIGSKLWGEDGNGIDPIPNSRWYGEVRSGIEIRDITNFPTFSEVVFHWNPRVVPEMEFTRPPGGQVVVIGGVPNYFIGYEAWDKDGGTRIEFYWDNDNTGYETSGRQIGSPAAKLPGFVEQTKAVPLNILPGDGTYYFFARLVPGVGANGNTDPMASDPRPGPRNRGRGHFQVNPEGVPAPVPPSKNLPVIVNIATSKLEQWTARVVDDTIAGAEIWEVEGSLSGVQTTPGITDQLFTSDHGEVKFLIKSDAIIGVGDIVEVDGQFQLVDCEANFDATTFKPTDRVRIEFNGQSRFESITRVPDPHTLVLATTNLSEQTNVSYRVHSFFDDNGNDPDRFTVITTGKSAYSGPIVVQNGTVVAQLFPVVEVNYPGDEGSPPSNPNHRVPLTVEFDASQTRDENGNLGNPNLEFDWQFGDGGLAAGAQVEHTYLTPSPCPNGFTVTVTVTNPGAGPTGEDITGTTTVVICVNPPDSDGDDVDDGADNCPSDTNADQLNSDSDTFGDACDNCPNITNQDQADFDNDDIGDVCDNDRDGDLVPNSVDNCLLIPNANQADADGDNVGNVCDNCPNNFNPTQGGDSDGDGLPDLCDNCPDSANPSQNDLDEDDIGDVCDVCPENPSVINEPDSDSDGTGDACDNCVDVPNGNQANADGDPFGDACDNCPNDPGKKEPGVCGCGTADQDRDGDGVPDCVVFGPRPPDTDEDGVDDTLDGCPFDATKTSEGICGCNIPDDDRDGDGVIDCIDNCPDVANAGQEDSDGNNIGDACDPNNGNGNTNGPGPNPIPGCGEGFCPAAPAVSMAPLAMLGIAMLRRQTRRRRK